MNRDGHREVLGLDVFTAEDWAAWLDLLRSLVARGLTGVLLALSDSHQIKQAPAATLPGASLQRPWSSDAPPPAARSSTCWARSWDPGLSWSEARSFGGCPAPALPRTAPPEQTSRSLRPHRVRSRRPAPREALHHRQAGGEERREHHEHHHGPVVELGSALSQEE